MNTALITKIDDLKQHLQIVYEANNEQTTNDAVLKVSQDLDILIVQYLQEQMREKNALASKDR